MEDDSFKERKEQIMALLEELSINQWEAIKAEGTVKMRKLITSDTAYIPKEYFSYETGYTAYRYILDNGGTAQEALEYAIKIFDKPEEWLEETKNRKYFYAKKVVEDNEYHPQQILMTKNGTMDKSALKKSETVNQQLRKLSRSKALSDELEALKAKDIELADKIVEMEAKELIDQYDIIKVQEFISMAPVTKREKASFLKGQGYTSVSIAKILSVNERTIRRWLNNK